MINIGSEMNFYGAGPGTNVRGALCHSPGVDVDVILLVGVGCVDKNLNLSHNFPTIIVRDLILHMCILCVKDLSLGIRIFDSVTLTLKFLKNFNLGHNYHNRRDRAFIFHMSK